MFNKLWKALNFAQYEAQNLVFHTLSWAPGSPAEWQPYFNSTSKIWFIWNWTIWVDPLNRTNHSWSQTASTISDFDAQVITNRLDELANPTASLNLNNQLITNLLTPVSGWDATNKDYVDWLVNWTDWKESARCATTANITLSWNQTIDWITTVDGDRILVKDQTTWSENGIYVAGTGAWVRSDDANEDGELTAASALFIEEWTISQDTQYVISTNWTIVIGTTAITFIQLWAWVSYIAGNGIDIAWSVISVDTAVTTRKYAVNIWDAAATAFTVTHNLWTLDIQVVVREIATWEEIIVPNRASTTSQCVIEFWTAPALNEYRVIVQG